MLERIVCFLLVLFTFSLHASEQLIFKRAGKEVKKFAAEDISKLLPPQNLMVFEAQENRSQTYRGFRFSQLLTLVYGEEWKSTEELLFTCTDGYQPSVPAEKFVRYNSMLAFEKISDKGEKVKFRVEKAARDGKTFDLGPFYLIWDNVQHPGLKQAGLNDWPYQVTTIDLIRFVDKFPKMAPPPGSSQRVKRGFNAYRENCFACHTINGEGGAKGVELNYPTNPTQYWKADWLKKWILDPSTVRFGSKMPALNADLRNRQQIAGDIIQYLTAISKNKSKPEPEKPSAEP